MRGPKGNRVYNRLLRDAPAEELDDVAEHTIWNWVHDKDAFFHATARSSRADADSPASGASVRLLDSVCCLLEDLQTQERVDSVRWRLLLYFLARFVDEKIHDVRDAGAMAQLLADAGWISRGREEALARHLRNWLKAGRNYVELASALEGPGALIYLPLWGRTMWEHHCHPGGGWWSQIVRLLRQRGVPTAAKRKRHDDRDAHQVVDALLQHWSQQCGISFLSCRPSPTPPPSRPLRRRGQKKSRRGTVPDSPSAALTPPAAAAAAASSLRGETPLWHISGCEPPSDDEMNELTGFPNSTTELSFPGPSHEDCHVLPTVLDSQPLQLVV